ncbi:putative suppressor protein srp40 protein [Botrytis fragariae]|uniref:Putative suppressor protein srp40 protein n=1 Tax=Botrytis fragariae TaxID=1964551 RepID=A0A8H6ENG3_9HELO|nr:putative suppressor protein srp40 protein [Botrytis fragariae]KAF5878702.1 putative suppressor protein srp40 protein [Botrytis fragariae]
MSSTSEYTRLHITPLNPNLLTTIIPPSVLPNAKNISYHTLETFQDRPYGFVDLPIMDAEKLKKKLHGSILKGSKIRIETARPAKDLSPVDEPEPAPKRQREKKDPSKKRKRGEETIPAVVIGDRKVKRGWTTTATDIGKAKRESKELKNVVKSKYTTNEECLFKTILPPNVAAHTKATSGEKSSRRSKKGRGTVVHEFAKSTKYATFLRSNTEGTKSKPAVEFVDGKGWVDEDGNVVEEVVKKVRKSQKPPKVEELAQKKAMGKDSGSSLDQVKSSGGESSSDESDFEDRAMKKVRQAAEVESSSSSDSESSADEDEYIKPQLKSEDIVMKEAVKEALEVPIEAEKLSGEDSSSEEEVGHINSSQSTVSKAEAESENDASSSGSDTSSDSESLDSSDSDSDDEDVSSVVASPEHLSTSTPSTMPPPTSTMTPETKTARPQSSSGLSITIPSPVVQSTPIPTEVHPLEALYKRSKPNPDSNSDEPKLETKSSSFSFFGADDEDSDIGEEPNQIPLTPFTQRDFESRGLRSSAPTPDTAYANKRFVWPGGNEYDDDNDEGNSPTPKESMGGKIIFKEKESEEAPESDFQKWFYEHRGENTRGWKKRRKAVAKEQRHRENKKRSRA